MKRFFTFIIAVLFSIWYCFIAKDPGKCDRNFRIADRLIQTEFSSLRTDYNNLKINRQQYLDCLTELEKKENKLFNKVKNHKFNNITESNYWHRGRLKFPSYLKMEIDRIGSLSGYEIK